jgi:hypothetical protein
MTSAEKSKTMERRTLLSSNINRSVGTSVSLMVREYSSPIVELNKRPLVLAVLLHSRTLA